MRWPPAFWWAEPGLGYTLVFVCSELSSWTPTACATWWVPLSPERGPSGTGTGLVLEGGSVSSVTTEIQI